jgi:DNA adenine methylase
MAEQSLDELLESLYHRGLKQPHKSNITDKQAQQTIEIICQHLNNRAPIRFLMACCIAKIDMPDIDIRAPYTEIDDPVYEHKKYSGRVYDEGPIERFVFKYNLPVRATTAFLTPAFRTKHIPLIPETDLGGHPRERPLYTAALQLLNDIEQEILSAEDVLGEIIRHLVRQKTDNMQRMVSLLDELAANPVTSLSAEDIVSLIQQHLNSPNSSRLPVLIVAAAYQAASDKLGEIVLPLSSHNAADSQTGASGDIEITLISDDRIITSYEMKMRRVMREDIDRAVRKLAISKQPLDNYIFITTDAIEETVAEYAKSLYRITGTEIVVLDCMSFLRHYLHLFHRLRIEFLNTYQELLLAEPDSAVRQSLKEAFLALRRSTESSYQL